MKYDFLISTHSVFIFTVICIAHSVNSEQLSKNCRVCIWFDEIVKRIDVSNIIVVPWWLDVFWSSFNFNMFQRKVWSKSHILKRQHERWWCWYRISLSLFKNIWWRGWFRCDNIWTYSSRESLSWIWCKEGSIQSTYNLCTGETQKAPEQILCGVWCTGSNFFKHIIHIEYRILHMAGIIQFRENNGLINF